MGTATFHAQRDSACQPPGQHGKFRTHAKRCASPLGFLRDIGASTMDRPTVFVSSRGLRDGLCTLADLYPRKLLPRFLPTTASRSSLRLP